MAFTYGIDLTSKSNRALRIDAVGGGVTYYGVAQRPEIADTDPRWMVVRETVTGTITKVEWAEGGGFDCVWANRATLTYSKADTSQP
jgi:hypothetical protein